MRRPWTARSAARQWWDSTSSTKIRTGMERGGQPNLAESGLGCADSLHWTDADGLRLRDHRLESRRNAHGGRREIHHGRRNHVLHRTNSGSQTTCFLKPFASSPHTMSAGVQFDWCAKTEHRDACGIIHTSSVIAREKRMAFTPPSSSSSSPAGPGHAHTRRRREPR